MGPGRKPAPATDLTEGARYDVTSEERIRFSPAEGASRTTQQPDHHMCERLLLADDDEV